MFKILIYGNTNCGKTFFMRKLIDNYRLINNQYGVYDEEYILEIDELEHIHFIVNGFYEEIDDFKYDLIIYMVMNINNQRELKIKIDDETINIGSDSQDLVNFLKLIL